MLHNSVDRNVQWWYNGSIVTHSCRIMSKPIELYQIAKACREWAEKFAKKTDDYPKNLCGMCAIASAKVFIELKNKGYRPELRLWMGEWGGHCFVVVDDHIVDITATQFPDFSDSKVLVIHEREADMFEFYKTTKVFETVKQLQKHQKNTKWPTEQIVFDEYFA